MTTVIDGTTGIDKVKDGSIVQADLGPNVAGNGPAFSAYQGVTQTLPSAASTKINLQQEEFDTANAFDSSTNYRFQPLVSGYYQLSGGVSTVASVSSLAMVYKNGAEYKRGTFPATGNGASISALVYLNGSSDFVELYGFIGTGGNLVAIPAQTYFQGFLARAA